MHKIYRVIKKVMDREGHKEMQRTRRDTMGIFSLPNPCSLRVFAVQNVLFFKDAKCFLKNRSAAVPSL